MTTQTETNQNPTGAAFMTEQTAVRPHDGDHRFFFNHLATVKVAAGEAESGMGVVEFHAPKGFGTPVHSHDDQDELLYIIDGELVLGQGDATWVAGAGSVVTLPAGVPHVFQVVSEGAHFLSITAGQSAKPKFEDYVVAMGDAVDPDALPEPADIDPARAAQLGAAHGIQILGPPPAPLA